MMILDLSIALAALLHYVLRTSKSGTVHLASYNTVTCQLQHVPCQLQHSTSDVGQAQARLLSLNVRRDVYRSLAALVTSSGSSSMLRMPCAVFTEGGGSNNISKLRDY
ncbi:hypothetical protein B0T26DRAFT_75472 [Lasiosphaeria miniovina]|uniref:Secreted protein n=1 Tax=Lasiosphaeria miniovina TaxID=1954250 RepID=A0AA40BHX7_9PEZI|nr:uncharacterized protein B0T26DRAFT_75472 [Lasiosphaeria miniovina]KAK0734552.1 hypothetical protein B0T26DRAFT_75472 [Lasiosphaeria miniovina]